MRTGQNVFPVILSSNNGIPPETGDRVRLDTSLASPFLEIIPARGGEAVLNIRLESGRKPEDGSLHFTGQTSDGTKVTITVHHNSSNNVFVYGKTSYGPPRGGTGVWVAEEEEDARGEEK